MLDKRHIMVDIETLGTGSDAPIFQIAMASFDINTGKIYDSIDLILDVNDVNLDVEGGTLLWWLNTNKELLTSLLNDGDLDEEEMYYEVIKWLEIQSDTIDMRDLTLWGNGIIFDNVKIKDKIESLGGVYPINYKNDRDVRTILALATSLGYSEEEIRESIESEGGQKHDAIDDVHYQIKLVVACYDIIKGGVR